MTSAVVTGASRGIGLSVCKALAKKGIHLVMISKSISTSSQSVVNLQRQYPSINIQPVSLDLSRCTYLDLERIGLEGSTILVNSAGLFPQGSFDTLTPSIIDETIAVNQVAPMLLTQVMLPAMKTAKYGRILNICSSSSYSGFPNSSLYCSTKHALLGLSRSLDAELSPLGIRCLSVSPGSVRTDMGRTVPNQDYSTFINPDEFAQLCIDLIFHPDSMIITEVSVKRISYQ